MNSTILFLAIVAISGVFMVIKSQTMKKTIAAFLKSGALVIDVRAKQEWDQGHFSTAVLIPVEQFEARLAEVGADKGRPVIVYCRAGTRAAVAETILRRNGFTKVINARGLEALKKHDAAR
jgi:phage shock protein E